MIYRLIRRQEYKCSNTQCQIENNNKYVSLEFNPYIHKKKLMPHGIEMAFRTTNHLGSLFSEKGKKIDKLKRSGV